MGGLHRGADRIGRYVLRGIAIAAIVLIGACPRGITDSDVVLSLTPATANLFIADTVHFTATLRDRNGADVTAPLAWTVDNPSVATVDSLGVVRAIGAGAATVRVAARGAVASAHVLVVVDSGQTLSVSPSASDLFVNGTEQLSAILKDHHGRTLPPPAPPQWSSSNTAVATVDGTGLVKAVGIGSATIEASVRTLRASAAITVAAEPPAAVLVGAGDIASCSNQGDSATAKLVDGIPGTVFVAGDAAYPNGTASDFTNCYAPTWGRFKSRTRPAPGNHEYLTSGAAGYFGYFGSAAGEPSKGYYSYDLGAWHIVVVNSMIGRNAGSAQEQWLRADLAANRRRCTLAYWHFPRFSSGATHGSDASMQDIWQALYDNGADVVISGHEHNYERFAPQTAAGQADAPRGIREFVVGTGGAASYGFGTAQPNSEIRYNATPGVLKLTLYGDHYDWRFMPTAGSFNDSGTGRCH